MTARGPSSFDLDAATDPKRLRPLHLVLFGSICCVAILASAGLLVSWLVWGLDDSRSTLMLQSLREEHEDISGKLVGTEAERDAATQRSEALAQELADTKTRLGSFERSLSACKAQLEAKDREIASTQQSPSKLEPIELSALLARYDDLCVRAVLDSETLQLGLREGEAQAQAQAAIRRTGLGVHDDAEAYMVVSVDALIDRSAARGAGGGNRSFARINASLVVPFRVPGTSKSALATVHSLGTLLALGDLEDPEDQILDAIDETITKLCRAITDAKSTNTGPP